MSAASALDACSNAVCDMDDRFARLQKKWNHECAQVVRLSKSTLLCENSRDFILDIFNGNIMPVLAPLKGHDATVSSSSHQTITFAQPSMTEEMVGISSL